MRGCQRKCLFERRIHLLFIFEIKMHKSRFLLIPSSFPPHFTIIKLTTSGSIHTCDTCSMRLWAEMMGAESTHGKLCVYPSILYIFPKCEQNYHFSACNEAVIINAAFFFLSHPPSLFSLNISLGIVLLLEHCESCMKTSTLSWWYGFRYGSFYGILFSPNNPYLFSPCEKNTTL